MGGKGYEAADDWAALVAWSVIAANALRMLKGSVSDALDRSAPAAIRDAINEAATGVHGVERIEKCIVRKSGIYFFVELHVEIVPSVTIREGHRIGHEVKSALLSSNSRIKDAMVHLEPATEPD